MAELSTFLAHPFRLECRYLCGIWSSFVDSFVAFYIDFNWNACFMFIIAQRWRDVVEAIVGVLATKGICIQCCRSNEKHVPFHYLRMAKLSIVFNHLWASVWISSSDLGSVVHQFHCIWMRDSLKLKYMCHYPTTIEMSFCWSSVRHCIWRLQK